MKLREQGRPRGAVAEGVWGGTHEMELGEQGGTHWVLHLDWCRPARSWLGAGLGWLRHARPVTQARPGCRRGRRLSRGEQRRWPGKAGKGR